MTTAPESPTTTPVPVKPRRRWARPLALSAAILVVAALLCHLAWHTAATRDLSRARAEAAAVGLSQDLAGIVPPPCADTDNAALKYERAYVLLTLAHRPYARPDSGLLDDRLAVCSDPIERERLHADPAAGLALIDHPDFAPAWALLAEGARLPRCRFDLRYEDGPGMHMPELHLLRNLAQIGSLRAQILAAAGRTQEAVDQFADILAMLRQSREEPLGLTQMTASSAQSHTLIDLRSCLAAGSLRNGDLSRLIAVLDVSADERAERWHRLIHAELAVLSTWVYRHTGLLGVDLIDELGLAESRLGLERLYLRFYASWAGAPLRAADEATYLRHMIGALPSAPDRLQPSSGLAPLSALLTPDWASLRRTYTQSDLGIDAAHAALLVAAGRMEDASGHDGLTITQAEDGAWLITPERPADLRADHLNGRLLEPWEVPVVP